MSNSLQDPSSAHEKIELLDRIAKSSTGRIVVTVSAKMSYENVLNLPHTLSHACLSYQSGMFILNWSDGYEKLAFADGTCAFYKGDSFIYSWSIPPIENHRELY